MNGAPASDNDKSKPQAEAKADVALAKPATPADTRRRVALASGACVTLWAVLCGLLLLFGEAVTRSSTVRSRTEGSRGPLSRTALPPSIS